MTAVSIVNATSCSAPLPCSSQARCRRRSENSRPSQHDGATRVCSRSRNRTDIVVGPRCVSQSGAADHLVECCYCEDARQLIRIELVDLSILPDVWPRKNRARSSCIESKRSATSRMPPPRLLLPASASARCREDRAERGVVCVNVATNESMSDSFGLCVSQTGLPRNRCWGIEHCLVGSMIGLCVAPAP